MSDQEVQERRNKYLGLYGTSEQDNFYVVDTIGVPHPYCITPRHVGHAADRFGGILGKEAIESAEKNGARCDICKGKLKFAQHEQALLVECKVDLQVDGKVNPELQEYLKRIVGDAEKAGMAGFAFTKAKQAA